jgi:hypothetical protein
MRKPNIIVIKNCVKPTLFKTNRNSKLTYNKVKVLNSLMDLTGIYNLLDTDDLKEFIKRTCLLLKNYNINQNFFLNDYLIKIEIINHDEYLNGLVFKSEISTNDVKCFFGAYRFYETINLSEKEWLNQLPLILASIKDKGLHKWLNNLKYFNYQDFMPQTFTSSEYNSAQIIAETIVKEIPEEIITKTMKKTAEKLKTHCLLMEMKEKEIRYIDFLKQHLTDITNYISYLNNINVNTNEAELLVKWYWLYCNQGLLYDEDTGIAFSHPGYKMDFKDDLNLFTYQNEKEIIETFKLNILSEKYPEIFCNNNDC